MSIIKRGKKTHFVPFFFRPFISKSKAKQSSGFAGSSIVKGTICSDSSFTSPFMVWSITKHTAVWYQQHEHVPSHSTKYGPMLWTLAIFCFGLHLFDKNGHRIEQLITNTYISISSYSVSLPLSLSFPFMEKLVHQHQQQQQQQLSLDKCSRQRYNEWFVYYTKVLFFRVCDSPFLFLCWFLLLLCIWLLH